MELEQNETKSKKTKEVLLSLTTQKMRSPTPYLPSFSLTMTTSPKTSKGSSEYCLKAMNLVHSS